jgi:glycosyltransferase involved in cell wall biosynthesis
MNILIVSYIYPNKDDPRLGLFVHEQAKELVRQGHNVFILTPSGGKSRKEFFEKVVVYRVNSLKFLRGFFFSLNSFFRIISLKGKIDIIHLHFIGTNSFFCWVASKIIKTPFVATAHGIDVCPKNLFEGLIIRFYLLFPKKIMVVSRFTYRLAAKYVNRKKLVVINNGVDMAKLSVKENIRELREKYGVGDKKVLLSVGGLVERKGIHTIIKSLDEVIKRFPNLIYFVIGKGPEKKKLKNLAKSLKVDKYIKFLGFVNNKEIAKYFALCDIFILMSKTIKEKKGIEGFGIAYIEAGALGKPVIGGKAGGTSDAIEDGKTGFLVEPEDYKELSKKIILLLKNKKLRNKMGSAGKERVLKRFLWKHNVKKTLKVYKEAIDNQTMLPPIK